MGVFKSWIIFFFACIGACKNGEHVYCKTLLLALPICHTVTDKRLRPIHSVEYLRGNIWEPRGKLDMQPAEDKTAISCLSLSPSSLHGPCSRNFNVHHKVKHAAHCQLSPAVLLNNSESGTLAKLGAKIRLCEQLMEWFSKCLVWTRCFVWSETSCLILHFGLGHF